jgi:hypothetical protein
LAFAFAAAAGLFFVCFAISAPGKPRA